jgi:prepilin-type N-terminal cleavage/methylation domain-containing protein
MSKNLAYRARGSDADGRGFTLVELLVVIAIIGLLVSLLLPSLKQARLAGLRAKCGSNLHQVSVASFNYAADWQTNLPLMGGAVVD